MGCPGALRSRGCRRPKAIRLFELERLINSARIALFAYVAVTEWRHHCAPAPRAQAIFSDGDRDGIFNPCAGRETACTRVPSVRRLAAHNIITDSDKRAFIRASTSRRCTSLATIADKPDISTLYLASDDRLIFANITRCCALRTQRGPDYY